MAEWGRFEAQCAAPQLELACDSFDELQRFALLLLLFLLLPPLLLLLFLLLLFLLLLFPRLAVGRALSGGAGRGRVGGRYLDYVGVTCCDEAKERCDDSNGLARLPTSCADPSCAAVLTQAVATCAVFLANPMVATFGNSLAAAASRCAPPPPPACRWRLLGSGRSTRPNLCGCVLCVWAEVSSTERER
eukprot:SAG11_NODE_10607_length_817_cov_1.338440_1_plen_188_part_01